MTVITRFAPSPTGHLHLGHAYSALFAAQLAQNNEEHQGEFLVRIEDIDLGRCKPEFEEQILLDLAWLGLQWQTPVRRQSDHIDDYAAALNTLSQMDILYPCFCTRSEIAREVEASGYAPHNIPSNNITMGPDGLLYPGTCRSLSLSEREDRMAAGQPFALRLDMEQANRISGPLHWHNMEKGSPEKISARPEIFGDVVLARKDVRTSYHLAVTLDDHLQGVTLVTRGEDLYQASHVHTLLQALLDLNRPDYHHHRLLTDDSGKRFAKRDFSVTLFEMQQSGVTSQEIRQQLGFAT